MMAAARWQFSRWVLIESFVVAAAAGLAFIRDMGGWVILLGLFATLIALRVQHLAAQRFQDLGQSKWWSLLLALPVINALVAVVLMVMTSKQTTAPALERMPLAVWAAVDRGSCINICTINVH